MVRKRTGQFPWKLSKYREIKCRHQVRGDMPPGAFAQVVIITIERIAKQERPSRTGQRGHRVRRTTVHRTVDEGQRSKTCQRRAGPRSSSDCVIGSDVLAILGKPCIEQSFPNRDPLDRVLGLS